MGIVLKCKEIHCGVWRLMVPKVVFPGSFGVKIFEPSVSATILSVGYGLVNCGTSSYSNQMDRQKLVVKM